MKILLDTQALILAGTNELPKRAELSYTSPENDVYFSLVSLWEIGIKASLNKLRFKRRISEYHDMLIHEIGLTEIPIEVAHIDKAVGLPYHHKDPFDRLLAGQALIEGLTVLSGDEYFEKYGCKRIWE